MSDKNSDNLKLTGDKINLESRPRESTRASSRDSQQSNALPRPSSTVPLLDLATNQESPTFGNGDVAGALFPSTSGPSQSDRPTDSNGSFQRCLTLYSFQESIPTKSKRKGKKTQSSSNVLKDGSSPSSLETASWRPEGPITSLSMTNDRSDGVNYSMDLNKILMKHNHSDDDLDNPSDAICDYFRLKYKIENQDSNRRRRNRLDRCNDDNGINAIRNWKSNDTDDLDVDFNNNDDEYLNEYRNIPMDNVPNVSDINVDLLFDPDYEMYQDPFTFYSGLPDITPNNHLFNYSTKNKKVKFNCGSRLSTRTHLPLQLPLESPLFSSLPLTTEATTNTTESSVRPLNNINNSGNNNFYGIPSLLPEKTNLIEQNRLIDKLVREMNSLCNIPVDQLLNDYPSLSPTLPTPTTVISSTAFATTLESASLTPPPPPPTPSKSISNSKENTDSNVETTNNDVGNLENRNSRMNFFNESPTRDTDPLTINYNADNQDNVNNNAIGDEASDVVSSTTLPNSSPDDNNRTDDQTTNAGVVNSSQSSSRDMVTSSKITHLEILEDSNNMNFDQSLFDNNDGAAASLTTYLSASQSLVTYLDEIDSNVSYTTLGNAGNRDRYGQLSNNSDNTRFNVGAIPRIEDLKKLSNDELIKFVIDIKLNLNEKSKSIELLQKEIKRLEDQSNLNQRRAQEKLINEKTTQKHKYEEHLNRHQTFINKLINEKRELNNQIKKLDKENKDQEERYNANTKALEHKHRLEITKMKNQKTTNERIKREKWIEAHSKQIKDITVKSIDLEIQNIERRHRQELFDIRMIHKKDIEEMELRNARRMQEKCEQIRIQMMEEREKILGQERDLMRLRYEQMVETEEKALQEQRRRLLADHTRKMNELEEKQAEMQMDKDKIIKKITENFNENLETMTRKKDNEIECLKEATQLEMETFKTNYMKQQQQLLYEKELSIKDEYKKDRDREIEMVIERFECDTNEMKEQMEETTENRIKRLKEKYEKEMSDIEQSEQEYKNKYLALKKQLNEYDETISCLNMKLQQLENKSSEQQEKLTNYEEERVTIKDTIKDEVKAEIETLKNELNEVRASKEKELEQIHLRIKSTIARKDELYDELQRDYQSLKEKCGYLENLLEQQREEYFIKHK